MPTRTDRDRMEEQVTMEEQAGQIVASFGEALRGGRASAETFQQAFETLADLRPVTELDRMHQLLGCVRLLDLLLDNLPAEEGGPLRDERARIFGLLQRQYGSTETPYIRSRSIVEEVAARLAAGGEGGEIVAEGMRALDALQFDAADETSISTAKLAVYALHAAREWQATGEAEATTGPAAHARLHALAAALDRGGFDGDAVLTCVRELRSGGLSLNETAQGRFEAVAVAVGLGLRAEPAAMPALEISIGQMAEVWVEVSAADDEAASEVSDSTAAEEWAERTAVTAATRAGSNGEELSAALTAFAARCEGVLAVFEREVRVQGVSEYLLDQALADLRELEPATDEDGRALRSALLRLTEIGEAYATPDIAETFRAMRESLIAQDSPSLPPLDVAGVKAEGERILQKLREELAGGAAPSAAIVRAMTALQSLGGRIADDDEAAMGELLRLMPGVVEIAVPYAEAGKELLAEDVAGVMREAMGEVASMMDAGPAESEIAARSAMLSMEGMVHRPLQDPFEQADAASYQRQFASLLRPLSDRLSALRTLSESAPRDAAEAKRIAERAEIGLKRLRNATTEAQWIEHQRNSLRRAVVDLRRFERRHHLMLIAPPWPTGQAAIDANAVFFGGGSAARSLVESACARIGMDAPVAHGVDDPVHTRWDLLRRSAVAVFDFTEYDPAAADPPGPMPGGADERSAIARAASAPARVAYECGWALVLGTPIVILARPDQPPPFDIDVEPVMIDGADDVVDRVTLAIQAALFGVQRGGRSADLGPTIARLRERFGDEPDCAELLDAIRESTDAMQVQLAARAMLEGAAGRGAMLTLPAFPPPRAAAGEPPTLFHVTAFRSWSKPCEEVVRDACRDAGIEYRIGYERLDPDILVSIWKDICGASLVVADLTNLNPNASLELAVAQALGRPTLVLSQTASLPVFFPALARVRVHQYATDDSGRRELLELVGRFIADQ